MSRDPQGTIADLRATVRAREIERDAWKAALEKRTEEFNEIHGRDLVAIAQDAELMTRAEEKIRDLRTRVATLEAALRDIVTRCSGRAGESDFSRWHWQTATDIGEILNTARAALKGE